MLHATFHRPFYPSNGYVFSAPFFGAATRTGCPDSSMHGSGPSPARAKSFSSLLKRCAACDTCRDDGVGCWARRSFVHIGWSIGVHENDLRACVVRGSVVGV